MDLSSTFLVSSMLQTYFSIFEDAIFAEISQTTSQNVVKFLKVADVLCSAIHP